MVSAKRKKSVIRQICPEKVRLRERKNNINEHRLFELLFGRTISEYKVWRLGGNYPSTRIEISFCEGLHLLLSDWGVYVCKEHNCPMQISIGRYRKMIRGYSDLFDEKLELYQNVTSADELEAEGICEQQIVGHKLEQFCFDMTRDVEFVYKIMSQLRTHEERLEILTKTEQEPNLTLAELVFAVRWIADRRDKETVVEQFQSHSKITH